MNSRPLSSPTTRTDSTDDQEPVDPHRQRRHGSGYSDAPMAQRESLDLVWAEVRAGQGAIASALLALQEALEPDPRRAVVGLRRIVQLAEQQTGVHANPLRYPVSVDHLIAVAHSLATDEDAWEAMADYAVTILHHRWGVAAR